MRSRHRANRHPRRTGVAPHGERRLILGAVGLGATGLVCLAMGVTLVITPAPLDPEQAQRTESSTSSTPSAPSASPTAEGKHQASGIAEIAGDSLLIPKADVAAPLTGIDFEDDTLEPPADVSTVGIWESGSPLMAARGTTVLVGHVSDASDRPGALYHLKDAEVGDVITVRDAGGSRADYSVTDVLSYDKDALPREVFAQVTGRRLVVITCDAKRVYSGGSFHYEDNLVVIATPVAPVAPVAPATPAA